MPTTTLRIIRLDAGAFAIQPSADDVRGTTGQRRSGRRFNWIRADTPSPSLLIPVANIPSYVGRVWKTA